MSSRILAAVAVATAAILGAASVSAGATAPVSGVAGPTQPQRRYTPADVAEGRAIAAGENLVAAERALQPELGGLHTAEDLLRAQAEVLGDRAIILRPTGSTSGPSLEPSINLVPATPTPIPIFPEPSETPTATPGTPSATPSEGPLYPTTGSYAFADRAGDLDGDGVEDVFVWDVAVESWAEGARGLSGSDGRELWAVQPTHAAVVWPLRADLDGDGTDDILQFAIVDHQVLHENCPEESWYCEDYVTRFTWEVTAASGADLAPLWTVTREGSLAEHWNTSSDTLASSESYTYDLVNGILIGRLLGAPGGTRMLLDTLSYSESGESREAQLPVVDKDQRSERSRLSHWFAVIAGDGGTVTSRQVGPSPTADAFLDTPGDVDGDGVDDILLEEFVRTDYDQECTDLVVEEQCEGTARTHAHVLRVLSGATLADGWSHAPEGAEYGYSYPLDGDLDGDGVTEVLHRWTNYAEDPADDVSVTAILSGADGHELWRTPAYLSYTPSGDLDGDGLGDLIGAEYNYGESAETLEFIRVRGLDGEVLSSSSYAFPYGGAVDQWGYGLVTDNDHDNDGAADLVIGHVDSHVEGEGEDQQRVVDGSTSWIESARTGATLWSLTSEGATSLWPLADVNDDGQGDYDWSWGDDEALHLVVVSGLDGAAEWTRERAGIRWGYLGDLGSGGVGLLYDIVDGDHTSTTIEYLEAPTGATRWSTVSRP